MFYPSLSILRFTSISALLIRNINFRSLLLTFSNRKATIADIPRFCVFFSTSNNEKKHLYEGPEVPKQIGTHNLSQSVFLTGTYTYNVCFDGSLQVATAPFRRQLRSNYIVDEYFCSRYLNLKVKL